MSRHEHDKVLALVFCAAAIDAGLRPLLAHTGTYGIFTDAEGARVVSFQVDLGGIVLSGNYKSEEPRITGTGWRIGTWKPDDNLVDILKSTAPHWATSGIPFRYTTLADHLKTYQASSKYEEYFHG